MEAFAARWLARSAAIRGTLYAATLFNAVLAVANANGATLNSGVVIGCEALLTATALALGIDGRRAEKTRWVLLCSLIVAFNLVNGFGSGAVDPKFIRDVLIIPVFILLGVSSREGDLLRCVTVLQWVVLGVMLFEAILPETFGRVCNVMSYYINTRGFSQDAFWNENSDLFVSATRPGERFLFASLNIHRLSSVFLEPVSLGNYCVIVAMVVAVLWQRLTLAQRLFFCVSEFAILVGCDGRFATVSIVLLVGLRIIAPALPRFSNWFYLPGILAVAGGAVALFHISPAGDDFPSRTAGSVGVLSTVPWVGLLGFMGPASYSVMDSGIAYLVYSQSLVGVALIWSFVALGMPQDSRLARATLHMVCLYFTLNLLISYSVFSIKTAALLWFAYGHMARHAAAYERRPVNAARSSSAMPPRWPETAASGHHV